jgi:xyloglucan-specific exo-beta-1,4-glucanase
MFTSKYLTKVATVMTILMMTFSSAQASLTALSAKFAQVESFVDLRVEALSFYLGQPRPPQSGSPEAQDVTISFRIVNAGATAVGAPFRTSVFPGIVTGNTLDTYYVTTPELGAGETVYISRTITLPPGVDEFDARIEADVDHILGSIHPASFITTQHFANPFILPPVPGQWFSIGPAYMTATRDTDNMTWNAAGRLTDIVVHPYKPEIIYVGSPGADGNQGTGLWKTTNGGQTWQPITESLPTVTVAAIAIDPSTDPERVYIATLDYGIFRSDDAGMSWTNVHPGVMGIHSNIGDGDRTVLLVDPTQPNVLYLTTFYGVQRSEDYGVSWRSILNEGEATALVMDPMRHDVLYTAIFGRGVYKTENGGEKWALQAIGPADYRPTYGILLGITHPKTEVDETVYALLGSASIRGGYSLFRTTTAGRSWDQSPRWGCGTPDPNTGVNTDYECSFSVMIVDPGDRDRVYFGGPILRVPVDGSEATDFVRLPIVGNDWQPASPHGDYHSLAFNPKDSKFIYAATDGGAYMSSNYAEEGSWVFIGKGITSAELMDVAVATTDPNRMMGATQDNGTLFFERSKDNGREWKHFECCAGDGGVSAIDPTNASVLYQGGRYPNEIWQCTDGECKCTDQVCSSWALFTNGLPQHAQRECATYDLTFNFQVHPTVPTTLFASCISMYRTTSNVPPGQWTQIFTPSVGQVVRSAVDPIRDLIYAGTNQGQIFRGPALGTAVADWSEVFTHPSGLQISDIEVDSSREVVYASFAPHMGSGQNCGTANRVYRFAPTSPGGQMNSTDITGDLPAGLCVNAVAIDPHMPRTVYAATTKGVYRGRSDTTGQLWVWESYSNGMPSAYVIDLEVHPLTGHLVAATYGRAAFELVPETILSIGIDIKPGTSENTINIKNMGKIPVAILSNLTFDAPNEVEKTSLTFGRTGNEASFASCDTGMQDVNADGLLDLVCNFYTSLTGFQVSDTVGFLKGRTVENIPMVGSDAVRIIKR